ncbi:hypothetical protein B0H16DRAFT_1837340 [Mycena metata]|uniref:Uncharacterized protein n=1 Tax=Mycena metata TaxID=1033252 RepID=A0AAD7IYA1_9AGAR|nr:hypothetical protein B0H16DRAFT_1837340 [Mycena metata]
MHKRLHPPARKGEPEGSRSPSGSAPANSTPQAHADAEDPSASGWEDNPALNGCGGAGGEGEAHEGRRFGGMESAAIGGVASATLRCIGARALCTVADEGPHCVYGEAASRTRSSLPSAVSFSTRGVDAYVRVPKSFLSTRTGYAYARRLDYHNATLLPPPRRQRRVSWSVPYSYTSLASTPAASRYCGSIVGDRRSGSTRVALLLLVFFFLLPSPSSLPSLPSVSSPPSLLSLSFYTLLISFAAPSKTHVIFQPTFGSAHSICCRRHWLRVQVGVRAIDVTGVQARAALGGCWRPQDVPARWETASSGVRGVRAWTQGRSGQDVMTGRACVYRQGCGAMCSVLLEMIAGLRLRVAADEYEDEDALLRVLALGVTSRSVVARSNTILKQLVLQAKRQYEAGFSRAPGSAPRWRPRDKCRVTRRVTRGVDANATLTRAAVDIDAGGGEENLSKPRRHRMDSMSSDDQRDSVNRDTGGVRRAVCVLWCVFKDMQYRRDSIISSPFLSS